MRHKMRRKLKLNDELDIILKRRNLETGEHSRFFNYLVNILRHCFNDLNCLIGIDNSKNLFILKLWNLI